MMTSWEVKKRYKMGVRAGIKIFYGPLIVQEDGK